MSVPRVAHPVTLQISLAPTDLPHAVHIVPHQLRQWAGQVDEVLLTLDLHRSRGKFADGWTERLPGMRQLIEDCCAATPNARSVEVDYGPEAQAQVAASFFGGGGVPLKDYRGAPFYSYLFSLGAATHQRVFHLDSDMLFGGGSQSWIGDALETLSARPEVLACNPLAGPPTPEGTLRSQVLEPDGDTPWAFRSTALSTRLFLIDLQRLPVLRAARVSSRRALGARMDGNPTADALEGVMSAAMAEHGLIRVDFLGVAPGMWAVHPPWRSPTFYERLPALVREIESGQVPPGQLGCHDVEDCMIDWSDVRPAPRGALRHHSRRALDRVLVPITAARRGS